jgi:hypothetical protein
MMVTVGQDGKVIRVEPAANNPVHRWPILEDAAAANLKLWTFASPASAPFNQTITYDYGFDDSLSHDCQVASKTTLDLPDRVTILSSGVCLEPSDSKDTKQ